MNLNVNHWILLARRGTRKKREKKSKTKVKTKKSRRKEKKRYGEIVPTIMRLNELPLLLRILNEGTLKDLYLSPYIIPTIPHSPWELKYPYFHLESLTKKYWRLLNLR